MWCVDSCRGNGNEEEEMELGYVAERLEPGDPLI